MSRVRVPDGAPYGPLVKWPKTPASHAGNTSSNLVRVTIVGADGGGGTPVPIPNTAVKPICAHDTWLEAARENRQAPTLRRPSGLSGGPFFGSLITVGGPIPFSVGFLGLSSCLRNRKTILWTVEFMNKKTEIQISRTFYKLDKKQNHNRDRNGKTSNFDFWDIWTKGLTSLRISKNQQQHTQYITQLHGYIFNFWIYDWLLYIN